MNTFTRFFLCYVNLYFIFILRLQERKKLEMKDHVVIMDIFSELIKEEMAVNNNQHMPKLYSLYETVCNEILIFLYLVYVFKTKFIREEWFYLTTVLLKRKKFLSPFLMHFLLQVLTQVIRLIFIDLIYHYSIIQRWKHR